MTYAVVVRASRVSPLSVFAHAVMNQLAMAPNAGIGDGQIANKRGRDALVKDGFALHRNGRTILTTKGVWAARSMKAKGVL